jgi:hypothetical protein
MSAKVIFCGRLVTDMPNDSANVTDREADTAWGEGCPSAYGICRPGRRSPQRSAHQTPRNYAHGFHVAKVENAPRHGTRFDGCWHCDSNGPSACVRQSRPGCGMGAAALCSSLPVLIPRDDSQETAPPPGSRGVSRPLLARRDILQCRANLVADGVQRKSRRGRLLQKATLVTPSENSVGIC